MVRSPVVSHLAFTAFACCSLFVSTAAAQAVSDNSSSSTAPLLWKSRQGFFAVGGQLGDSDVNVKIGLEFVAEQDAAKDLLRVDMTKGALLAATWGDGKSMSLSSKGSAHKEGFLAAEYQLAPTVELFVDATAVPFGQQYTFNWNANQLYNQSVPGSAFNYHAANKANFEPWGWDGAKFTIPGASLATSKLVAVTFDQIIGANTPIGGDIAINMTTTPTLAYRTTSIALDAKALTKDGDEIQIAAVDTDYLEVEATVKGEITYEGTMDVRPTVNVTSINTPTGPFILPQPITFDLNAVGQQFAYSSSTPPGAPIPVEFGTTRFHIPLPNVKMADKVLDMGTAELGHEVKKAITINNTGEMGAVLQFESSDPAFTVTQSTKIATKDKYNLEVAWIAQNAGPASAKVTVKSNDPNEPVITIDVLGNGAKPADPPAAPPAKAEPPKVDAPVPGMDSGCGCVTAGHSQTSTLAGLGLFGALGAIAALRRRK